MSYDASTTDLSKTGAPPQGDMVQGEELLLEARNIKKHFPVRRGLGARLVGHLKAVDGVNLAIRSGQTFGLVGESGCGKTTASRVILRIEPPTSGQVFFRGREIYSLTGSEVGDYRRSVQAVFQDPTSSLDPRMRVGKSIAEPIVANRRHESRADIKSRVAELLKLVGLKPEHANLYPHEFSGGMRQRIAVARALAPDPELIVLDEPVSALDVSIRAQIMSLLKELQDSRGFAYLFIAHNLATVRYMSHQMGVMYVGKLVEEGDCEKIFKNPMHPYTKALIHASLPIRLDSQRIAIPLRGEIPSPLHPPPGCYLNPRCPEVMSICSQEEPVMREEDTNHRVSCHLYTSGNPEEVRIKSM
ncbi:ABC transporter ATP-binding protein [Chloroflexota bacterium]